MNHNAIFINNYGAGVASVVKLDEQAYNQFTSPNDAEFGKFKKAYADGKLEVMPTPGYSAGVGIPLDKYPSKGDGPEGLYSFAAENRTTDASLEKVAIDPTFIENLFLGTKNATQHTEKYNIKSYIVHDSAGRTDYVLMYNKSTGKAGISPLGVFYGLRLRVTELDEARFREMVKNYGGAVEAEHKALLSIADGGYTSYKDDQDESVGEISTTIGNKLPNSRMLVSLRSTKNTGTLLYAGDYHGYFNIDRESFINNGYYEYIKNTPYMYTPDDFGDTVGLFKDAFYMFTDGEIDWNVLTELLKKLPEDVRIKVPGPFSTGGTFDKPSTVMPQQDTTPSTLNSRTLLDKVLSSTDPDLQGELEGLSFKVVRGREKYGTEDETYDDGTTDYVVLTAQDGEERAIRLLEVLKSDVVDFTGLPRWTGGKPRKELGSAGFCARALAKAYQNRGHIVYSHGYVGNGEPVKAVACMPPSGLVALGVIYQPPEVGTWGEDKSRTAIYDAKFDNFFSGEPVGGEEMFYNDVDAFKKWLGNPMQGAEVSPATSRAATTSKCPAR